MNFLLSEDQEQLLETVRRFAKDMCDAGARRALVDGDGTILPTAFWQGLMELGVGGVIVPAEYGGLGLGMVDLALVAEALGHAGAPGPFLGHALATIAIAAGGSDDQKRKWLPRLASGEVLGTVALTARGGSSPSDWDGSIVDGCLTAIRPMTPYASDAQIIVAGIPGGQLALVEPSSETHSEVLDVVDRTRPLWSLSISAAAVEALGAPNQAAADRLLSAANILLAADAFGGALATIELTRDYVATRRQFGGPIGRFQGVKYPLANAIARIEPIRGLYWYAAYAYEQSAPDAERVACLLKAHAGECFMQTARDAIEAHGGIGYTWEYDAHIWLKRAMFDYSFLGTPDHHRARAARLAGWSDWDPAPATVQ